MNIVGSSYKFLELHRLRVELHWPRAGMRKTSLLHAVGHPTVIANSQPNKSIVFSWNPRLPETFPRFKSDGTNE